MDRGIWATWYDIQEQHRKKYMSWLHSDYLPQLLMRPGYMWAAHYEVVGGGGGKGGSDLYSPDRKDGSDIGIGIGTEFILLVGAATPHTFFNPSLAQLEKQQDSETREMLALRQGTRTCILTEVDRVDGPEIIKRPTGTTPGPVIQMGAFNMQTIDDEFELAAWYAQDRLMAIAGMRGAIGARKMVSIAGWAKHSVLYEFISHEARDKEFIKGLEGQAPEDQEWSVSVINSTVHGPGSPSIAQRIWPEV